MKHNHPNHIILHDGEFYYVFERLGKFVPFEAYNVAHHKGKGSSLDEVLENTSVPIYDIHLKAYEVVFNE